MNGESNADESEQVRVNGESDVGDTGEGKKVGTGETELGV